MNAKVTVLEVSMITEDSIYVRPVERNPNALDVLLMPADDLCAAMASHGWRLPVPLVAAALRRADVRQLLADQPFGVKDTSFAVLRLAAEAAGIRLGFVPHRGDWSLIQVY
jgi:acyl CoA:acetate/3-ketoacid CoA transferase alpha subunit